MRKMFLAPLIALAAITSACETTGSYGNAPAPLASSIKDEHALLDLWAGYDAVLKSVDDLRDSGQLVPGSVKAKQVQTWLIRARDALQAASAARRALNTTSYEKAFSEAQTAIFEAKNVLGR